MIDFFHIPNACRRARLLMRRAARLPPHSNGVGLKFHPLATPSSKAMICSGVSGFCPFKARCTKIRYTASALFSQEPPIGVNKVIIPC
jgi:hypothetical protein